MRHRRRRRGGGGGAERQKQHPSAEGRPSPSHVPTRNPPPPPRVAWDRRCTQCPPANTNRVRTPRSTDRHTSQAFVADPPPPPQQTRAPGELRNRPNNRSLPSQKEFGVWPNAFEIPPTVNELCSGLPLVCAACYEGLPSPGAATQVLTMCRLHGFRGGGGGATPHVTSTMSSHGGTFLAQAHKCNLRTERDDAKWRCLPPAAQAALYAHGPTQMARLDLRLRKRPE